MVSAVRGPEFERPVAVVAGVPGEELLAHRSSGPTDSSDPTGSGTDHPTGSASADSVASSHTEADHRSHRPASRGVPSVETRAGVAAAETVAAVAASTGEAVAASKAGDPHKAKTHRNPSGGYRWALGAVLIGWACRRDPKDVAAFAATEAWLAGDSDAPLGLPELAPRGH